uniref:Cellouronate lyase n=1 Tax=Mizuhopecten yessoensis TaxID=6573 RepID=A0A7I8CY09_MIZYE|nr:cellouronate lyase [Mizuhopecten yessoensis]
MLSLVLAAVCLGSASSRMLWESPHSVDTGDERNNFHVISHGTFGQDDSLTHAHDPTDSHRNVMKVKYADGSYSGTDHRGVQFYSQPTGVKGHSELTLSYDVYFAHNFDWVRGGKLPGLWGGTQTCSGHRSAEHCFSTRFMWRGGGDGEVYAYIPHEQYPNYSSWCKNSHIICNDHSGQSIGRGDFVFGKEKWQKLTQYVKLNNVGSHDGVLKVWLDHKLVYHSSSLVFRKHSSIHIDGLFFSTFFGGGDDDWASTADTYTLFRDFRLYDTHMDPAGIAFG